MKGCTADEETRIESKGEWSQNSQWIEDIRLPFFRSKQLFILEMLYGHNLLSTPSNVFWQLSMVNFLKYQQMYGQFETTGTTTTVIVGGAATTTTISIGATITTPTPKHVPKKKRRKVIKKWSEVEEDELWHNGSWWIRKERRRKDRKNKMEGLWSAALHCYSRWDERRVYKNCKQTMQVMFQ